MAYCVDCGKELSVYEHRCTRCGKPTNAPSVKEYKPEGKGLLWLFIGIANPVVGLIIHLIFKHEKPVRSKQAIRGMVLGIILYIVGYIFFIWSIITIEMEYEYYGILFEMW